MFSYVVYVIYSMSRYGIAEEYIEHILISTLSIQELSSRDQEHIKQETIFFIFFSKQNKLLFLNQLMSTFLLA